MSRRSPSKDKRLERAGLLDYQTKGMSADQIAERYKQSGIRVESGWFEGKYGKAEGGGGGNAGGDKPLLNDSKYKLPNPITTNTGTSTTTTETWDYKSAQVDMKGNVPLTYKLGNWDLKPEGFDPNGEAYFGKGLKGWAKGFAYKALQTALGDETKTAESKKLISDGFQKMQDANKGGEELTGYERFGDTKKSSQGASGLWDVVKGAWGVGVATDSKLAIPLKGVNLAAKVVIDGFQAVADTTESVLNMNKTMRTYAEEHGSQMPELGVTNFDPIEIGKDYAIRDEVINTWVRTVNPLFAVYDTVKFFSAPGTLKEKTEALKTGWYEGRMLYTELVKPSVEAEFKRRMMEPGANPDLLAMELQDPFVELVGELVIDPLNLVAAGAKTAKFADKVNKAGDLGGVANQMTDVLKVASKSSTDAQIAGAMDEAAKVIVDFGYKTADDGSQIQKVFGKLEYGKATALNSRGMITKQTKNMSEFITWMAGGVKNKSGSLDDLVDSLGNLVKLSSKNVDEVKDAMSFLKGSKYVDAPMAYFGQQALETSHLLRNMMGEGGDIEKLVSRLKNASWDDQAKILNEMIQDAAKTAYPTITDMAAAAKKVGNIENAAKNANKLQDLEEQLKLAMTQKAKQGVKSLEKQIAAIKKEQAAMGSAKDIQLAQEYARMVKEKPAIVALAKFDAEVRKPWNKINSAFSNIYFTNYGFAARQYISNSFMVFKEGGTKAWIREGKFQSIGKIKEELALAFPAGIPKVLGQESLAAATVEASDTIFTAAFKKFTDWKASPQALAAATEQAAGERVFYRFYRDHMDNVTDFGKALPSLEEFAARGFSPEMANDYKAILKSHGYNPTKAMEIMQAKYANGVELFRDTSWISEDIQKGLKDYGGLDSLQQFLNKTDDAGKLIPRTKEDVTNFIDDLIDEADARARQTVFDPNGVSTERAVDHIETFGGDAKELRGFGELQTHISNATNASIDAFKSDLTNASATARKKIMEFSNRAAAGEKLKPDEVTWMKQLNEWLGKAESHIKNADEMYAQNGNKLKELKRDLDAWMKENKFLYNYGDTLREAKWQEWYKTVEQVQEQYFQFYNGGGMKLAEDFGLLTGEDAAKTFSRSRQATVEVQKAKMVVSSPNGGLFHVPPKGLVYSKPGVAGHDGNVSKLADYFGISSVTSDGAPLTKKLLATINKYSDSGQSILDKLLSAKNDLPKYDELEKEVANILRSNNVPENVIDQLQTERRIRTSPMAYSGGDAAYAAKKQRGVGFQTSAVLKEAGITRDQIKGYLTSTQKKYSSLLEVSLEDAQKAFQNKTGLDTNFVARLKGESKAAQVTATPQLGDTVGKLMDSTTTVPRSELPTVVSERIATMAKQLKNELSGGEAKGFIQATDTSYGSTNAQWYSELYKDNRLDKPRIDAAIDRIIKDQGADKGKAVELVKEKIMGILLDGGNGQPPDLYVLKELGAPEKMMQDALDNYNEITKGNSTLEEALQTMGAPISYDEAGNLVVGEVDAPSAFIKPGGVVDNTKGLLPASPIHPGGSAGFSEARAWAEGKDELTKALKYVEKGILDRFGRRSADVMDAEKLQALQDFEKGISDNVAMQKLTATKVGAGYRDFALHPYGETTNLDHAAQYIFPYHFWYSRTYANFGKSLVQNADMIAGYGKLKDYMAQQYKEQPEWFKYNVKFPDFLGINNGNPYMFNLESAIWPLQGITGVDFQDETKRTNWFTATIDDLGKFGPSTWTPISLAIGAAYQIKGEKDIAAKWGTRIIPQTATVKAVSSYLGKPIEFDPGVQFFSGKGLGDFSAMDPYEEGRVSRALAAMEAEGIPQEQLIEAARTHSGELWDEAYKRATQTRAPGQLMSTFLGVAFRPRTEDDIKTDNFYSEYGKNRSLHDAGLMSDEDYKQSFNDMREKYPFMDIILLSRRAGMGREAAYAYNVISRIPPGMTKEVYNAIGVDADTAQKFYESGGKLEGMSETEQQRFMAAMVDAGAMLAIPSNTTRQEWTDAKNMYNSMRKELGKEYGDDIQDKISLYFGMDDKKAAKLFIDTHPEVAKALDAQTAYIANNPQLLKYYGGMDTLDRYATGVMYDKLEKKYGSDITNIEGGYFDIYDSKEKKAYLKAHPELTAYWDEKAILKEQNIRSIVAFGDKLPDAPKAELTGNDPANPSQQGLQDLMQPAPERTFEEWSGAIGAPMTEIIQDYWYNDKALPKAAKTNLDYMADEYGYEDGNALLKAILGTLP